MCLFQPGRPDQTVRSLSAIKYAEDGVLLCKMYGDPEATHHMTSSLKSTACLYKTNDGVFYPGRTFSSNKSKEFTQDGCALQWEINGG